MDEGSSRIYWIFTVIILILLALFFAMCETAFASVSRNRMKTMADKGDSRAKKALHVLDHFDTAITTILICTNIVHIAAASVVTVNVTRIWGISAVTISTIMTTLAVFFFGEILPKSIARKYCDSISLSTAGILSLLMTVLSPVSWILTKIGNAAASLTKGDGDVSVTEEELYDIIIRDALFYQIEIVEPEEIDRLNILEADRAAMTRIALRAPTDIVLTDAVDLRIDKKVTSLIKGDTLSCSIAAGSILAKVTRDRIMVEYDKKYPEYGFAKHKGYGTRMHLEALQKYGVTPIHRRSFRPVFEAMQPSLF